MKNKISLIALLFAVLMASCKEEKKEAAQKENYYETMSVTRGERTLTTGYSAAISGVQTVEIRPQISGMITEILIEEGSVDIHQRTSGGVLNQAVQGVVDHNLFHKVAGPPGSGQIQIFGLT